MSDAFISYSRKDREFTQQLMLTLQQHGLEVWVDWEEIPPSVDWWSQIRAGIESADNFLFILSPDSLRSAINQQELDYAVHTQKRIIPLLLRDVDASDVPPVLASINWLHFRSDENFENFVNELIKVLYTDLEYVSEHTRLLLRAHEWEEHGRNQSFLLSGEDIRQAEQWIAISSGLHPPPSDLHLEYIYRSRQFERRRQTVLLVTASVIILIIFILAGVALTQTLRANELAAQLASNGTRNTATDSSVFWITAAGLLAGLILSNGVTLYLSRRRVLTSAVTRQSPQLPKTMVKINQHIFLSYSRKDKELMGRLEKDLNDKEIPTWTDENLEPGTEEWERQVELAIKTAGCMVVLLTPEANESKWVRREIAFAEEFSIRVFPLLIRGDVRSSIPARLINHERIDMRDKTQYGSGLERLINGIVNHVTTKEFQERIAAAH